MVQGFLARESERVNMSARKTLCKLMAVEICFLAVYFFGKDALNLNDPSYGSIVLFLVVLIGISLALCAVKLIATGRIAQNGSNLYLPYQETTQAAAADIIDTEALEGNILVDEYIDHFTDPKKASGEKIILTPSYLLICGVKNGLRGMSKVTAIPRDKVCWTCAQVGQKGGPFIVRLLIFTEKKLYSLTGTEIDHVENIASKLYQYIPNIFSDYDPFTLSYQLEEIFVKNPADFLNICAKEKEQKSL